MDIWICNGCHAEIPQKNEPESCPLCRQTNKGFEKGTRADSLPEDEKYSLLYLESLKQLEEYDDGCEPEHLKFFCNC